MAGEKTEKPTAKRLQDERKKGNVFKSQEIDMIASVMVSFTLIGALGSIIVSALLSSIRHFWGIASYAGLEDAVVDTTTLFMDGALVYIIAAVPVLLATGLVAIIVTFAQTRGLVSMESAKPKFSKLSPLKGIKKMFSLRGLVELLKSILKVIILGYVAYSTYMEHFPEFPNLMSIEHDLIGPYIWDVIYDMVKNVMLIFVPLAAADYMYQRWQHEKDLRMSKHEIKEEFKQTEGDPQIKGKIRQKQRQMAQMRMMAEVPTADVIIRNPTHYAIAIRYKNSENKAPMVIAKGADLIALRIIKTAEENDVIIVENKPLARGLYEAVPLEREIPEEFYQPVAEVLAFVYNAKKKKFKKTPQAKQTDGV